MNTLLNVPNSTFFKTELPLSDASAARAAFRVERLRVPEPADGFAWEIVCAGILMLCLLYALVQCVLQFASF